jgi:hypothetical protein
LASRQTAKGGTGPQSQAGKRRSGAISSVGRPGRTETEKIGRRNCFNVELEHHLFGDLAALGRPILEPSETVLHFADTIFETPDKGLIAYGGADNGSNHFMKISEALQSIGEGLLINGWIFLSDAITKRLMGNDGKRQPHECASLEIVLATGDGMTKIYS